MSNKEILRNIQTRKTEVFRVMRYRLDILGGVDLDAGAHGSGHGAGTDILALGSSGLSLDDGTHQGLHVLGYPSFGLYF